MDRGKSGSPAKGACEAYRGGRRGGWWRVGWGRRHAGGLDGLREKVVYSTVIAGKLLLTKIKPRYPQRTLGQMY